MEAIVITIPPDAEVVMIPRKWLEVLRSIANGPFLPINFPLPIVVSAMVPDGEIWFVNTLEGDMNVITKERINEGTVETIGFISNPNRLLSEAKGSN